MKRQYHDLDPDALIRGVCKGSPLQCKSLGRTCRHCMDRDISRIVSGGRRFWK